MYYDYKEKVKEIKPHRVLAINRAEKENIINVNIEIEEEKGNFRSLEGGDTYR